MEPSIALDATHLETGQPTGVEHYSAKLLPRLSCLLRDKGVRVYWIGHSTRPAASLPKDVYWQASPYRAGWGQTAVPFALRHLKVNAYFTPSGIAPVFAPCATAMTVHDLAVYDDPQSFSAAQRWRLAYLDKLAARRCALLLTPSQFTKGRIEALWGIPGGRLAVTPLAAELDEVAPEPVAGVEADRPFVLFIGRIEQKKNLLPVLQALALGEKPGYTLVLGGRPGVGSEPIYRMLPALKETGRSVVMPGFITPAQRRWLYEQAAAVIVPGMHEGFGLPVLEAMAYGVPCLCAGFGSLPEVGGTAALYVQENTPEAWRTGLDEIVYNQKTRERLRIDGRERVEAFSWDRTAQLSAQALLPLALSA